MTLLSRKTILVALTATAALALGLTWNGRATLEAGIISSAEARIGRPLTPMSYAGVARRTTRRAVVYGGAAAVGAYALTPRCAQVTDAYGRIVTRC